MGGAILADILMGNNGSGVIEIGKHLYRFFPEFFKVIFHRFVGIKS